MIISLTHSVLATNVGGVGRIIIPHRLTNMPTPMTPEPLLMAHPAQVLHWSLGCMIHRGAEPVDVGYSNRQWFKLVKTAKFDKEFSAQSSRTSITLPKLVIYSLLCWIQFSHFRIRSIDHVSLEHSQYWLRRLHTNHVRHSLSTQHFRPCAANVGMPRFELRLISVAL